MNRKPKILVADDDIDTRTLIKRIFAKQDYEILESSSGKDALAILEKEGQLIDLMLLDIKMPDISGLELLDILKNDQKVANIKIIMLSGSKRIEDKTRAFSLDASDYLVKPFENEELIAKVEMLIKAKQAEDNLAESEERYRLLAENASDVIWTMDMDLNYTYISPSITKQRGFSVEEMMELPLSETMVPDSVEIILSAFREELAIEATDNKDPKRTLKREIEAFCKDGSTIWCDVIVSFIRDSDGKVIGIQGISRDITERRQADQSFIQKELYYRSLIENSYDAMMVLNKDATIRYQSPSYERILGYTLEDQIGKRVFDVVHPDDRQKSIEHFKQLIQKEDTAPVLEVRAQHKNGSLVDIEICGNNLLNDPVIDGVVANFREVTERKQANNALRESEERFRVLADTLPQIIFETDEKGNLSYVNEHGFTLFGYSQQDFEKGINVLDTIVPEEQDIAAQRILEVLQGQSSRSVEYTAVRKDGSTFPVSIYSRQILRDGVPAGIRGLVVDITESKQAEEKLAMFQRFAEASGQGLGWTDLQGTTLYVNPALARILSETDPQDTLGKNIGTSYYPEDEQRRLGDEVFPTVLKEGQWSGELTILKANGEMIPTYNSLFLIRNDHGDPLYYANVVTDITERKQAEETLRDSEEKLNLMFSAIGDGISLTDLEGNIIDANKSYAELLGFDSVEETKGMHASAFIAESYLPQLMEHIQDTLEHEDKIPREYIVKKKDGSQFPAETSAAVMKDAQGVPIGFISINRDITERKEAEEALQESELNLNRAQQMAHIGSWIWDIASNRTIWSEEMYRIFDMSRELEPSPDYVRTIIHPDDLNMFNIAMEKTFGSDPTTHLEFRIVLADDTVKWVSSSAEFLYNHTGDLTQVVGSIQDITERKEADQALRESEEKYRLVTDNISDVVSVTDANLNTIYVSPSVEFLRGYTPEEARALTLEESVSEESYQRVMKNVAQDMVEAREGKLTSLTPSRIEVDITRKDGTLIPVELMTTFILNDDKDITHFVTTMRDITERKEAEKKLLESQAALRSILDNMIDGVTVTDMFGGITEINPATTIQFGYEESEVLGKMPTEVFLAESSVSKFMDQVMDMFSGKSIPASEYIGKRKDGSLLPISVNLSVIKDPNGNPISTLAVHRDITEQKKLEDAVKQSEQYFRALIENSSDAIVIISKDGSVKYTSPSYTHVLGYDPNDRTNSSLFYNIHPDDMPKVTEEFSNIIKKPGGSLQVEIRARHADESWRWIEATGVNHLEDIAVAGIVVNMRDITDRKEMEEEQQLFLKARQEQNEVLSQIQIELQKALDATRDSEDQLKLQASELLVRNQELNVTQEQLSILNENLEERVKDRTEEVEKLLKHKDEFIGQLGHDLKSPLTPLVTLLPMIAKREQDPKQKELLELSVDNVNYMKELVVKTLQLARVSSSTRELITADIDLSSVFNKIISAKRFNFEKEKLEVVNNIGEGFIVKADQLRLEELLDNLISNAVKFTPKGGTITLDVKKSKGFVTVSVKDTGVGMTKDQLARVFDEFYKADPSRHELNSSGLGLAICWRITEKLGGKIWAESEGPNKGSTFYFTISTGKKPSKKKEFGKGIKQA